MAPSKPRGVTTEKVTKRGTYGAYGSDEQTSRVREPGRPDREPWQGEERVERTPARPIVRQWASASYDPETGRAARVANDKDVGGTRDGKPESWKQIPDAGRHTAPNNSKGRSRPGRW